MVGLPSQPADHLTARRTRRATARRDPRHAVRVREPRPAAVRGGPRPAARTPLLPRRRPAAAGPERRAARPGRGRRPRPALGRTGAGVGHHAHSRRTAVLPRPGRRRRSPRRRRSRRRRWCCGRRRTANAAACSPRRARSPLASSPGCGLRERIRTRCFRRPCRLPRESISASYDLRPAAVRLTGARIVKLLTAIVAPRDAQAPLHRALQRAWAPGRTEVGDVIRAALVLCADHELNVSAFTARCAASAGASPYDVVSAAIATLRGYKHGGAGERVLTMLAAAETPRHARAQVAARLRRGEHVPGFGHPLYPNGDPRAALLMRLAESSGNEAACRADAKSAEGWVRAAARSSEPRFRAGGDHPRVSPARSGAGPAVRARPHDRVDRARDRRVRVRPPDSPARAVYGTDAVRVRSELNVAQPFRAAGGRGQA